MCTILYWIFSLLSPNFKNDCHDDHAHFFHRSLELRQYKNDTIHSKINPVLNLPRFFPRRIGDEKEWQFQNLNFFRLNGVDLILS